jgi:hypothetical protein
MDAYIKFEGHYVEHVPGGMSVGSVTGIGKLGNGTTVEVPRPFISIGNNLGVTPVVEPDGQTSLRIDFARWSPLRYGQPITAGFPFNFASQDLAVRVARAFDADPQTSWRDPIDAIASWLRAWLADQQIDHNLPSGVLQG